MSIKFILLFGMFIFCHAIFIDDIIEWHLYKHKYSKNYATVEEDMHRMMNFLANKRKVDEHNQEFENGIASFRLKLNEYSDLSHAELVSKLNGHRPVNETEMVGSRHFRHSISHKRRLPKSVDWRDRGAVTDVKNQGTCGSCWAFSVTGAIEGQHFIKTGELISLSEQNLVDCVDQNFGCAGGDLGSAYQYISQYGIEEEVDYPYQNGDASCKQSSNAFLKIRGFERLPDGDEKQLQYAIAYIGPIAASMHASGELFSHYSNGIFHDHNCPNDKGSLDHGVLIVGYGTDEHERDYYIVKNSYGDDWGEDGYFRIIRNHHNHCGIATETSYPIV